MSAPVIRRLRPLFGTFVEVGAVAPQDGAVEAAFEAMHAVQRDLSFQDPSSELSRLNRSCGEWVQVSRHTVRVLRLARAMMIASNGLFDCTVGAKLVRRGVLPRHGGSLRAQCGRADDIEIGRGTVRLRKPIQITLDGIAKGYGVDLGIRTLERLGVSAGWINAGGDMRAFGSITLPVGRREIDGSLTVLGGLNDAAVATSAATARHSKRFPGAIVGAAGRKAERGIWTVIASRAWRADALTKVAALANAASRNDILQRLGGRLIATGCR